MMMNTTLAQLRDLKLAGMVCAVEEQLASRASTALSFEERLALMVDREVHHRSDKRRAALLKRAGLKYPQACVEDVDGRAGRGFERSALMSLALSRWIEEGTAILATGPTGSGKSWLACALAQYACRRGHSALYLRMPRLAEELRILHGNGGFTRWLAAVARTDVVILDDWGMAALDAADALRSDGTHRRPCRHARDDRDEPVARRALACLDRRRDPRGRHPRSTALAQSSTRAQGQVDAAAPGLPVRPRSVPTSPRQATGGDPA